MVIWHNMESVKYYYLNDDKDEHGDMAQRIVCKILLLNHKDKQRVSRKKQGVCLLLLSNCVKKNTNHEMPI
jgi:hypothetical protein